MYKVIGTLTVSGKFPIDIDGLNMGWMKKTKRFKITDKGFLYMNKLIKTHDPRLLCEDVLNVFDYSYSYKLGKMPPVKYKQKG